jgi:hypothetical protein
MYEGTALQGRLGEARSLLEETLDADSLYQVRESARITYYRHVVPTALEPKKDTVEDALPLFIMYASNAADAAAAGEDRLRPRLPVLVYRVLEELLAEKREPPASPIRRGIALLRRLEEEAADVEDLGAYYSLVFAVAVVVQVYASGVPVMRLSLAPLYALARAAASRLPGG